MSVEPLVDVVTGEVIDVALTPTQARDLTDRIRTSMTAAYDLLKTAFLGRAWTALGYTDWDSYCAGEFAGERMVRLPREQRQELVADWYQAGISLPAISTGLGVGLGTAARDVDAAFPNGKPVRASIGTDGKTYQPPAQGASSGGGEPSPSRQPKRKPLTDSFRETTHDLDRVVQKLVRLTADDRFSRNAEQVAIGNRGDLLRAAEALAGVLDRLNHNNSH